MFRAELFPRVAATEGHLPFGLPLELKVDDPDTIRELVTFREGEPRAVCSQRAADRCVGAAAGSRSNRR